MARIIICGNCGEDKPYHALGLCRICYQRQWWEAHPKRNYSLAQKRRWAAWKRNYYRQYPEKHRKYVRRYYEKNCDAVLNRGRRWGEEHKERKRFLLRRWRENNPEKEAAIASRQRARRANSPITLTSIEIMRLLAIGKATFPGEKLHLDHFVPLSKGGGTTAANIWAIPARVNLIKHDKLPEEIFEQTTFL